MEGKNNKDVGNYSKKFKISLGVIAVLAIIIIVLLISLLNIKTYYMVDFNSNGGSSIASIIVDKNGFAVKPEDPIRENYIFAGWYYNDELFDFSTPIKRDIKLEARWIEIGKVAGITLDKNNVTLKVGDKAKLNAIITPENALDKTIKWESSNPNIVSVDADGNITALKEGAATITVTTNDGGFTVKVEITVAKKEEVNKTDKEPVKPSTPSKETIKVNGISLNKTNLNLYVNETTKLTANIKPSNASNKGVKWVSSNSNIATVDSNGNIKAIAEGKTTITVTTNDGNYTASCVVTVSKKPDNYVVTFTAKPMEGTGSVMQYTVSVTKNGALCSYNKIIYNGRPIDQYPSSQELSNKNGVAEIILTDGNRVKASSVIFR